jgi:two-component system sensor histidine kinase/response regulator
MTVFGATGPFGAPAVAPTEQPDLEKMRGARVLLVEDNETNQLVASEILGQRGLVVDVASNGQEGVDAARNAGSPSPYAVIFLDIQMPVLDGYDAARGIRRLPGYADVPIVALTAEAMEGTREKCLQAGMNDYIAKPLKPAEIYACLDRWIGKAAAPSPTVSEQLAPEVSRTDLLKILLRLIGLLERDDLGAVGCMDELASHPGAAAYEMELGRIAVLIRGFQFERALERLAHFRRLIDPE